MASGNEIVSASKNAAQSLSGFGKALTKHAEGQRAGGALPKLSGSNSEINAQGAKMAEGVLSNPASKAVDAKTGVTTVRNEAGQGVSFTPRPTSSLASLILKRADKMQQQLEVSIASDIVNDSMSVELHLRDRPIIVGLIKDDKRVIFPGFSDTQSFSFEEVRAALAEFVQKMESTENVTID